MRLAIYCEDRLGITQQMLSIIVQNGWDLGCVEMYQHHAFLFIDESDLVFEQVSEAMKTIEGVLDVTLVDLMPSERRRIHLDALLGKLPDPIIDINNEGKISVANREAAEAFGLTIEQLEGSMLTELINCTMSEVMDTDSNLNEVYCDKKLYTMDVTKVTTQNKVTGAVIILRSPQRLGQQIAAVQPQKGENIESMVGQSAKMKTINHQTRRFAALDLPVLIQGETGTGKELLARALHESGPRAKSPFLAINCATLPENLLESELFGYAPGAFTGAQRGGKPGLVELAEKGTIFLDEIGEMSIYLQAKLLRFLQDFTFRRIGGSVEMKVDVRIVCATHKDIEAMTQSNEFREDLYYRLNVLNLHLPPLRERLEDIPALVKLFALRASEQINADCPHISNDAMMLLEEYSWPGNIRQLQNVVFRTIALAEKPVIDAADVCFTGNNNGSSHSSAKNTKVTTLDDAVAEFEKNLLAELYLRYPSTRRLAQRLSVSHAKISRKLNKYGISKG